MTPIRIFGGTVLLGRDGLAETDIHLEAGTIAGIGTAGPNDGLAFDARGLLVLPGIVDIHGDAFERQIQPRPGVDFPLGFALEDTERQLLSNGITTAFHGITLSWEPGLRGLDAWHAMLVALEAGTWTCDMRVHLRWETHNLDALDTAIAGIEAGRVHLLAFNNHAPSILRKLKDPVEGAKYAGRAGMKMDAFQALADRVAAQAGEVPAAEERIAAAARAAGLAMASHDDDSVATRARYRALGAHLCEFPIVEDAGHDARVHGEHTIMGSPNVVRGRSHLNWASAAAMAEAGVCDILSSDYFYPAMLRAAFVMTDRGTFDLARAWGLIAANPAKASGLTDRGSIETGKRADIVLVDPIARTAVATIASGRLAYLAAAGASRLRVA